MRNRKDAKDWVRLAAKLSLFFTEPKVRAAIGDRFKEGLDDVTRSASDKYDDVADTVARKYEDTADRLEAAADALQGRTHWPAQLGIFLVGAGVGVGLGVLLAPASGRETRQAVVDATNKVVESATNASARVRQSVSRMPSTGTEG